MRSDTIGIATLLLWWPDSGLLWTSPFGQLLWLNVVLVRMLALGAWLSSCALNVITTASSRLEQSAPPSRYLERAL